MKNKILNYLIDEAFKTKSLEELQKLYPEASDLEEAGKAWFKFPLNEE
jgi:hypothetical protein